MLAIFDRSDLIWTSDRCNKHKEEGAKRGKWKHVGNADLNKSAIYYWVDPTAVLPFPQGTDGFLYYYSNPRLSPMLGEIRFRITPSSSPKSFDEGADLLLPRGSPWCIPFLILVTAKKYQKLREVLLRDGLITNDLVDQCARVIQQTDFLVTRHHRYIHSLKYPFYMDFGSYGTHRVIGDDKLLHVNLSSPLFQERLWPPFRKRLPYTGQSERSAGFASVSLFILMVLMDLHRHRYVLARTLNAPRACEDSHTSCACLKHHQSRSVQVFRLQWYHRRAERGRAHL